MDSFIVRRELSRLSSSNSSIGTNGSNSSIGTNGSNSSIGTNGSGGSNPSDLMTEISNSDSYREMKDKMMSIVPPVYLWIDDNTIYLEADRDDSLRYEMTISNIESPNNIVDFTIRLFDLLNWIYELKSK